MTPDLSLIGLILGAYVITMGIRSMMWHAHHQPVEDPELAAMKEKARKERRASSSSPVANSSSRWASATASTFSKLLGGPESENTGVLKEPLLKTEAVPDEEACMGA